MSEPAPPSRPGWGAVVVGTAAVFGVLVSSALFAVAVAGFLQWGRPLAPLLDNGIPLLVLLLGMLLCGRVAVDVAGSRAVLCAVGAALLVLLLGLTVSRSSEAHGDGLEVGQVVVAVLVVLVVVGAGASAGHRRRRRRASR
jgi:hypothetical protein